MEGIRDCKYYDERLPSVKLEDITSSERNADILRKLLDGDSDFTLLYVLDEAMDDDYMEFIVEGGDDLGWLGYLIGQNDVLQELFINCRMPVQNDAFIGGISRNRSIEDLVMHDFPKYNTDLGSFFRDNKNLTSFTMESFFMDNDLSRNLASVLAQNKTLKRLTFDHGDFALDGEVFAQIVRGLGAQCQLEDVSLEYNNIGNTGCAALGTTITGWNDSKLKTLNLTSNDIDDEGLRMLLGVMTNCRNLTELKLCCNSFSVVGLRSLSTFLSSKSCILEHLSLSDVDMDNDGAEALAAGLMKFTSLQYLDLSCNMIGDEGLAALVSGIRATAANSSLETLQLSHNRFSMAGVRSISSLISLDSLKSFQHLELKGIDIGDEEAKVLADALVHNKSLLRLSLDILSSSKSVWKTFSRMLCDTSSINNIYSSNHTLERICSWEESVPVEKYLHLNRLKEFIEPSEHHWIPMRKILMHNPDLADIKPFFQWKLKFLPMMVAWFKTAEACRSYFDESAEAFQSRSLSVVYKFIRGMPLLAADGFWSQQLKQIRKKKRRLEEEEKQVLERLGRRQRASSI